MIFNPFDITGKRILITGASSGIGKETAITASKLGAELILVGRNEERLNATLSELEGKNHQAIAIDFIDDNAINNLVKSLNQSIDGIVHSAGILTTLPFKFSNEKALREIFKVNFESPYLLTQQLIKGKLLNNGASVVFVSSLSGVGPIAPGISMYAATKGALSATTRVLALELAKNKIRVNCVAPGMVKTNMNSNNATLTEEDLKRDEMRNYPLGYGEPSDVANGIVYFLSDASKWITGNTFVMDGGASLQ